ncbi:Peptidoglycan-associated lipoprotein [Emticicia aquatica]|jgi:outer membrane protein OmpA-like peptidoglycan-associated protein/tetratricopeptide (TPR) repeat protein|uniref:Peptidoglycan-associated lipoprotein n=1 Tax=Emticicia aquatica TaxID=1681835 RepID=A0ABM9AQY7_9BACT|nr:OmpA family protein [Emticicia aquatica]CAH0996161.1 Peptidoglycan-associated lipoprotein [Emticicia aquatica]
MIVRKKIIGALVVAALLGGSVKAQEALLKTGEHHYESLSYVKAIDAFEAALKKKGLTEQQKLAAKIKLGDSYAKIKDTQNAERVYSEIINASGDVAAENINLCLKYAQVLASNGKYREAQEMYDKYTRKVEDDPRGKGFSKLYNDVSVLSKNANCYKVDYLSINTNAADFAPAYYKNGMVFVSNRHNTVGVRRVFNWNETPFLDLFFLDDISAIGGQAAGLGSGSGDIKDRRKRSSKSGTLGSDEYTAPTANDTRTIGTYGGITAMAGLGYGDRPVTESERFGGSINSKYHEGPAAFFKDGSKVIFTRNNFNNGKARRSSDGINKLKLYIGEASKDSWKNIKELPFNSDEYSTGHPALSADEKLLFFASDMPGGFGGTDIYVSRNDGGSWSAPINLGKTVNSKGNEMFPFVDEKGNLYFSSDGHAGLGDLDIFFVQLDGTTSKGRVINLGAPVNSSKDDFGIVTDALRKAGYFSSNRKRGGADDDIYKFDRECELKEGCDLIIAIYDAETKMPLDNAKVVYEDKDGNIKEKMSDADGSVKLEGLDQDVDFAFRATRDGYGANTVSFSTKDCENEASRLEIPMSRPKPAVDSTGLAQNGANGTNSTKNTPNAQNGYAGETTTQGQQGSTTNGKNGTSGTTLTGNTCTIRGRVMSQGTKQAVDGVLVTLRSECDGSTQTAYTDATGNYEFIVMEGCDYTVEGSKDNLGSKGKRIRKLNCKKGGVTADVYMFGTGDIVQVDNIYFDYGKCNLRSDARAELDKLVSMMRKYPKMRIELRAHTDSRSEADFNQKISEGRAKISAGYLFKRGISRSRVEFAGYGETMPVNGCVDGVECTEEQHAQNRRTEIKILQMN